MRIWGRIIGGLPCLQLTLLLVALHPAASQPLTENENEIAALPPDADNVEVSVSALSYASIRANYLTCFPSRLQFHHVKVVNGVMHEDHPVVMYKEDFVSEDYGESNPPRLPVCQLTFHFFCSSRSEQEREQGKRA